MVWLNPEFFKSLIFDKFNFFDEIFSFKKGMIKRVCLKLLSSLMNF